MEWGVCAQPSSWEWGSELVLQSKVWPVGGRILYTVPLKKRREFFFFFKQTNNSLLSRADDEAVHHPPCVLVSCCVDAQRRRHVVNTSCPLLDDDTFVWREAPVDYLDGTLSTHAKGTQRTSDAAGVYFSRDDVDASGMQFVWLWKAAVCYFARVFTQHLCGCLSSEGYCPLEFNDSALLKRFHFELAGPILCLF